MPLIPTIDTPRLRLRPYALADGPAVRRLAGAREVAATTLLIPHPYPEGAAETWIGTHAAEFEAGRGLSLAIELRDERELVGAIGLTINRDHSRAEMGYWVGVPYWGRGYCTEAAGALVAYAFDTLGLHRVFAYHFEGNDASGRVMRKIGMQHEGRMLKHNLKWGRYLDSVLYGIVKA